MAFFLPALGRRVGYGLGLELELVLVLVLGSVYSSFGSENTIKGFRLRTRIEKGHISTRTNLCGPISKPHPSSLKSTSEVGVSVRVRVGVRMKIRV